MPWQDLYKLAKEHGITGLLIFAALFALWIVFKPATQAFVQDRDSKRKWKHKQDQLDRKIASELEKRERKKKQREGRHDRN